jgi:hypothetical protein
MLGTFRTKRAFKGTYPGVASIIRQGLMAMFARGPKLKHGSKIRHPDLQSAKSSEATTSQHGDNQLDFICITRAREHQEYSTKYWKLTPYAITFAPTLVKKAKNVCSRTIN